MTEKLLQAGDMIYKSSLEFKRDISDSGYIQKAEKDRDIDKLMGLLKDAKYNFYMQLYYSRTMLK